MGMSYEDKMKYLADVKPEKKDILLLKILRGEVVDITKDEDLFYQINKDRVSLTDFTNRTKFSSAAKQMKEQKREIFDSRHAMSKNKKMRWLGDIPAEIYFSRPEFSPLLSKAERTINIKKWLNQFTTFRAGDATL